MAVLSRAIISRIRFRAIDLLPEAQAVAQAFGNASLTFSHARLKLDALWAALKDDPGVKLKRDLWDGLMREAYGEDVGRISRLDVGEMIGSLP